MLWSAHIHAFDAGDRMIAVERERLAREGIMVPDEDISGEHACP